MRGMICGLGQVGYRVALLALRSGHHLSIVTIKARPEWERELKAAGAEFFFGDARDEDFLVASGLREVDWLISATTNDLTNIEIALDAKRLHHGVRTVARVFDQYLATRLESNFGIDRVLAMSQLAAPAFISAAFGDELVASFKWEEERFGVVRVKVTDGHVFAGRTLNDIEEDTNLNALLLFQDDAEPVVRPDGKTLLKPGDTVKFAGPEASVLALGSLPKHADIPSQVRARNSPHVSIRTIWRNAPRDLRFLLLGLLGFILVSTAVFRIGLGLSPIDAFYFVVSTVTTTGYGDITPLKASVALKLYTCLVMLVGSAAVAILYSIITDAFISARFQQLTIGHPVPDESHVIVVGLGDVGYRTCEELLRLGIEPVGIDLHGDAKFVATLRTQMAVITGDAREPEILEQANFENAAAIILTTSDDVVNLSVGLLARDEPGRQRIVLRIFDDRFASKVQSTVAFDGTLSASRVAAPTFLSSAAYPAALASFVIRDWFTTIFERSQSEVEQAVQNGETIIVRRGDGRCLTMMAIRLRA